MNRSQALQYIEELSEKGELEAATNCYAVIVIDSITNGAKEKLFYCQTPKEQLNLKKFVASA